MTARLAVLLVALAPAALAAAPRDQRSSDGDMKSHDLITDYGSNAELPPDRWSCAKPAAAKAKSEAKATPLQRAADLKCLTEWLWSVQRYFAAGGKAKKGLEPEFVAGEKKRAAELAHWLSKWAAAIAAPESKP